VVVVELVVLLYMSNGSIINHRLTYLREKQVVQHSVTRSTIASINCVRAQVEEIKRGSTVAIYFN